MLAYKMTLLMCKVYIFLIDFSNTHEIIIMGVNKEKIVDRFNMEALNSTRLLSYVKLRNRIRVFS